MAEDVEKVIQAAEETGLTLNESKCEIIASNFDIIENIHTFREFRRVASQHMTLLGAPVLKGPAVDLWTARFNTRLMISKEQLVGLLYFIHTMRWCYYATP